MYGGIKDRKRVISMEERYNVVFLDCDGVINDIKTKEKADGTIYKGADNEKIARLKEIVTLMEASIILTSTWKSYPEMLNYLYRKFAPFDLDWIDVTKDHHSNRGEGIHDYLMTHPVGLWIVLDDEVFRDYEEYDIMDHLIKTSFYFGGLKDKHVQQVKDYLAQHSINSEKQK